MKATKEGLRIRSKVVSKRRKLIPDEIRPGILLLVDFESLPDRFPGRGWEPIVSKHRGLWVWLSNRDHTKNNTFRMMSQSNNKFRIQQGTTVIVLDSPVKEENMPNILYGPQTISTLEICCSRGIGVVQWHPAFRIVSYVS